jgi:hypothetical protein
MLCSCCVAVVPHGVSHNNLENRAWISEACVDMGIVDGKSYTEAQANRAHVYIKDEARKLTWAHHGPCGAQAWAHHTPWIKFNRNHISIKKAPNIPDEI